MPQSGVPKKEILFFESEKKMSSITSFTRARLEAPSCYPQRWPVVDPDWTVNDPNYRPHEFTAKVVFDNAEDNENGSKWADVERIPMSVLIGGRGGYFPPLMRHSLGYGTHERGSRRLSPHPTTPYQANTMGRGGAPPSLRPRPAGRGRRPAKATHKGRY